jgi:hypothetical protein
MLPDSVRHEAISRIYQRLDELRWEERSSRECSAAYSAFLADPLIGGALAPFMSRDRVRLWIKDGPAKEYRRALQGTGPYAHFSARRFPGAEWVAETAAGPGWEPVEDSFRDKPIRCVIQNGESFRHLIWGPLQGYKDLLWQAMNSRVESPGYLSPLIVVTKSGPAPLSGAQWRRPLALASIAGCELRQLTLTAMPKP